MEHVILNWRTAASLNPPPGTALACDVTKNTSTAISANLKCDRILRTESLSPGNVAENEETGNSRMHLPTMHPLPPPRSFNHRTTDLRVGLVFRDSIVKKYYRKYCLVRTRTPQAEGESRGRSRARGIIWKLRKTAMLQPLLMQDNCFDWLFNSPVESAL